MRRDEYEFRPSDPVTYGESELVRAIFQTAVDCIITINDRGLIESINPAVERNFGFTRDELVGHNVSMLMPSPDREQHDSYIRRYLETGERRIIGTGREIIAKRKDGSTFPAYLAVSEMRINGQRKFAGIIRDISDRKHYEQSLRQQAEELRQARDELAAAIRAKDNFIAVLSHELRTPLTPALAMLTMLEQEPHLSVELKESLRTIRRNIELESRLIDDLLDLTRVTRGKMHLNLESTDVHKAVAHTLEICAPDIKAHLLNVQTQLAAQSHHVMADPARLRQVLWNLVKNAVKFTPRGGRITITTRNEPSPLPASTDDRSAARVVIEVRDTGIGMEQPSLERIFNAFEQGSSAVPRQFGGLGLGLAISRTIVEMHHGRIWAQSDGLGKGSSFTVDLPLAKAPVANSPVQTRLAREATPAKLRILLVDDHADTLRVIALLLQRSGHEVITATTLAEARQKLAQCPAILISDLGLPDGSGFDLMREAAGNGKVKGIALSGYGMEEDIRNSLEAGFHEHLTKPVDLTLLLQAIARVAGAAAKT